MHFKQLFLSSIDLVNICQHSTSKWNYSCESKRNMLQLVAFCIKSWLKSLRAKLWMKIIVDWLLLFMNESHVVTINSYIHSYDKLLLKVQFMIGLRFMNERERHQFSIHECLEFFFRKQCKINHNAYDHITASPAQFKTQKITHEQFYVCRQPLTTWNCTMSVLN